jgi:hypothetical protein
MKKHFLAGALFLTGLFLGWLTFSPSSNVLIYTKENAGNKPFVAHYCGREEQLTGTVHRLKHACEGKLYVALGSYESDGVYITPGVKLLVDISFDEYRIEKKVATY